VVAGDRIHLGLRDRDGERGDLPCLKSFLAAVSNNVMKFKRKFEKNANEILYFSPNIGPDRDARAPTHQQKRQGAQRILA
jgi:hypothetical protein